MTYNENYTHILYFNGCPKFFGSLEECETELARQATTARLKRFYRIEAREAAEERAAIKMADYASKVRVHSAPEYDRFGDERIRH
jgi:hypothetical protein